MFFASVGLSTTYGISIFVWVLALCRVVVTFRLILHFRDLCAIHAVRHDLLLIVDRTDPALKGLAPSTGPGMMLNIQNLIDDFKCFETVGSMRWPDGVSCPHCASTQVIRKGHDDTQPARQRYACSARQRGCNRTMPRISAEIPALANGGAGKYHSGDALSRR